MNKRRSILGDLDLTAAVETDAPKAEAPAIAPTEKTEAPKQSGLFRTSLYMPHAVREVLREIAFQERKTPHDLYIEGLDHILKSRRHPSFKELAKVKAS